MEVGRVLMSHRMPESCIRAFIRVQAALFLFQLLADVHRNAAQNSHKYLGLCYLHGVAFTWPNHGHSNYLKVNQWRAMSFSFCLSPSLCHPIIHVSKLENKITSKAVFALPFPWPSVNEEWYHGHHFNRWPRKDLEWVRSQKWGVQTGHL